MLDASLHLRFDATTHPDPTLRAEAWRDAMALSVEVAFTPGQQDEFVGSLSFHPLGSALLIEGHCTPHSMMRRKTTIDRWGSGHILIDFFSAGGFSGSANGHPLEVAAGDCFLMDFRGTLSVEVLASRFIGFVVPRALFETHMGGARSIHGLCLSADSTESYLIGSLLESLVVQAPHLSGMQASALGLAMTGLICACLVDKGQLIGAKGMVAPKVDLVRLRRYIWNHAADPGFGPDVLAHAFGLSRTALYRLLAPNGGAAEAIRRRRAEFAAELLQSPAHADTSVEIVARSSGFANARSLGRALRDFYGKTPSQMRKAELVPGGTVRVSAEIAAMFDATER